MAKEYIMLFDYALYNEDTGEACFNPKMVGELVRCKDCIHTEYDGCGAIYCKVWDRWEMPEDYFCADGERRSE